MYGIICLIEFLCLFLLSKQLTRSISLFLYKLKFNQLWTIRIIAIIFLPGTLIHELSHLLIAGLLGVQTGDLTVFPKLQGNTIRMGSVQVAKVDHLRQLFIGLAPVLSGLVILFISFHFFFQQLNSLSYWIICIFVYLLFVITNSMFSSKKDVEGAGLLVILSVLIFVALFIIDKQFLQQIQNLLMLIPSKYLSLSAYYLSLPLILDIGIIFILRLLIRIKTL
ncbi:MAG TPA: M50 family metallopeptidase [Patescibacteria group bacterium]|nr:M50 family metallopeptidase [Patescibacteria group bacterium]